MDKKTILILGGYGNTGRPLARLLLQESDAQLVLAGRNLDKAQGFANELNQAFEGNRVRATYVDASDLASMRKVFSEVNFVVMASSTTQFTRQVATAALEARIGYLDIQYSTQKNRPAQIDGSSHTTGWVLLYHRWRLPSWFARIIGPLCSPIP